jgi:hypothetical protein
MCIQDTVEIQIIHDGIEANESLPKKKNDHILSMKKHEILPNFFYR